MISGIEKVAVSLATQMSLAMTRPKPAPSAGPLTAAIVGFEHSTIALWHSRTRRLWRPYAPGVAPRFGRSRMSAPAEKILPWPVITTAITSSRSLSSSYSAISSSRISALCALTGGRFSVTSATRSATSRVRVFSSLIRCPRKWERFDRNRTGGG